MSRHNDRALVDAIHNEPDRMRLTHRGDTTTAAPVSRRQSMLVTACVLDMAEENATLEVTIIEQQTNISFRVDYKLQQLVSGLTNDPSRTTERHLHG